MSRTAPLSALPCVGASILPGLLAFAAGLVGCGGASAGGTAAPVGQLGAVDDSRDGRSPETAWHACMDTRSDYRRVAEYRCEDGSMPLGGSIPAGGAARSGNIGAGPDGHVLDRYVVPCPEGDVVLFVDMYHCDEENGPLSEAELRVAFEDAARYARAPDEVPHAAATRALRAAQQLGIRIPGCNALFELIIPPEHELPNWRTLASIYTSYALVELYPYRAEYAAGLTPERRADLEEHASLQGALGMVDTYRRLVAAGHTEFQHPQLEQLAASTPEDLNDWLTSRTTACRLEAVLPGYQVQVNP